MASSLTKAPGGSAETEKTFLGHPRGLANLFMTEMWERYSFYGMRALLVLYLATEVADGGLGMKDATAVAIYSVYNAMVYLLALPGGWLGDRVWGARKAVAIAGIVIMTGHFLLAVPAQFSFFLGLAFIAAGSGVLKANISTMVGHLYPDKNDSRRDSGFTIFYMGINLGAFVAPLTIGAVGQKVNWHLGFALAGVGMAIGLLFFFLGYRHLNEESTRVPNPLPASERTALVKKGLIWLGVAAAAYAVVGLSGNFHIDWVLWPLTVLGLVLPAWYLFRIRRDKDLTPVEQGRMTGYIWFFVAAAVFWAIYDQGGSVLTLFAKNDTETALFGFDFPESWFQSLNPLFVMAMAPLFAMLWVWLGRRNKEPSTASKFATALLLIGGSFFVMMLAQGVATGETKVSPMWLVSVYFMQTVGELCLSPVGLSLTTKLAPEKYSSQMMGVWFLAVTAGSSVIALLQLIGAPTGTEAWFASQGALALLAGAGIFMYRRKVKSLMGGVH
ncbi:MULTISPECIES: peptide MFS transporter [Streptomyces]|uniref:MFS transporter n=1 Tax=Streptomyces tsukubensis (strain DSM 42081 / NBRC 108919 / NRRL 18488 / 9993) TaxID=1114943 RepID=I2MZA9_STRT9|nr:MULTISPECIES: oligopeptide:H+ symporter [Streptomyces]AZK94363.1 MFS transporter [Streptomyces tsukubensis]EIF90106.1 Di-/tripeptide transporter [Streptomyces tsukubensis NRRL18488]MYS64527.1 MFS transporter [Streptomyces sp. SID5473]QKM69543.1 MFS transporter [Streptomyces tsukubensis NRRL18488]TAI42528.1 MFS transporter [Streptomyces tsukubensis]